MFALEHRSLVMISLYVVGILIAAGVSKIYSTLIIRGEDTPFVMELPPYRMPTAKAIARHTWEKGKEYLKKMGGIILVASIVVWALGYFPHGGDLSEQAQQENSYIGRIGKVIEPVFAPQHFNWKLDVSLLAGVGAKEIVASTLVAYCYLLFVLLYFPCLATIAAIRNETGSWKWALVSAGYTTVVAWVVSALAYQIGSLLF